MPEPIRPFFSATPYQRVPLKKKKEEKEKGMDSPAARKNFLRLISLKPDINVNVARVWKSLCDRRMAYTRFGLVFNWW